LPELCGARDVFEVSTLGIFMFGFLFSVRIRTSTSLSRYSPIALKDARPAAALQPGALVDSVTIARPVPAVP
jgi:hypothetical protein